MKRMTKSLCMFFCLLLVCIMITVNAETAPFKVAFTVPNGWTNGESIDVTIRVEESADKTMTKLEYKSGKDWQDITEAYKNANDGRISVEVTDNKTLKVRITDSEGQQLTEEKDIECFDREPPKVSAVINEKTLDIVASDTLSGIAGVQVNGLLFTVFDGDEMSIPITDTLTKYERLAVRAFDYAGNFSEPVSMINTCYEKLPDPTPAPTATKKPKETKDPVVETEEPIKEPETTKDTKTGGSSSIYFSEKETYSGATPEPAATPTPIIEKVVETVYETEYITLGPGMPYQSDGNSHTTDMLYSAATNKQFITLQTKNGNTFYLVIDYDKPIDEDAEMYETYFMNLVDERDLMALLSDEEKEEVPTPTPQIVYVTPEPTAIPIPTDPPVSPTEPAEEEPSKMTGAIALVVLIAIGAVITFILFNKNKNSGSKHNLDNDFDMEDDEEESGSEE